MWTIFKNLFIKAKSVFRDERVGVFRITTYQKLADGRLMSEVTSKIQ